MSKKNRLMTEDKLWCVSGTGTYVSIITSLIAYQSVFRADGGKKKTQICNCDIICRSITQIAQAAC